VYEYLSERVALPGLVVGALALLVGLSTSSLMVSIAIAFAGYLVLTALFVVVVVVRERKFSLGRILLVLAAIGMPVVVLSSMVHENITKFGASQVGGLISFSTLSVMAVFAFRSDYKASRKVCPECVNVVSSDARVCRHCGYRWLPPLQRSY
jgi:ribosomal protein L40E